MLRALCIYCRKGLENMTPHGLTFGEHCGKSSTRQILLKFLIIKMFYKLNTMFMRNEG